jgi:hypothetical protein
VPLAFKGDLPKLLNDLVQLYVRKEAIPGQCEFPEIRPALKSHEFPKGIIDVSDVTERSAVISRALNEEPTCQNLLDYYAPWWSPGIIAPGSLDLILSQAVLEHIDQVDSSYKAMFAWLKKGAYASHVIDFRSHRTSHMWNGHWAYSTLEWKVVRGRREFLLNREPLSVHLKAASEAGFRTILVDREYDRRGFPKARLSRPYRSLECLDAQTSCAMLVLLKA